MTSCLNIEHPMLKRSQWSFIFIGRYAYTLLRWERFDTVYVVFLKRCIDISQSSCFVSTTAMRKNLVATILIAYRIETSDNILKLEQFQE